MFFLLYLLEVTHILTTSSKYTSIPTLRDDDNVIPPASELPGMLKNLAHPRKRSVSVGPQSAADAYETLAYRNRRRRESVNSLDGSMPEESTWSPSKQGGDIDQNSRPTIRVEEKPLGVGLLPTPMASRVQSYEHMMGAGNQNQGKFIITNTPPASDDSSDFAAESSSSAQTPAEAENEKREIFMKLPTPRVRYDVEVVAKLIVYTGEYSL
jgi:hypothetical protein